MCARARACVSFCLHFCLSIFLLTWFLFLFPTYRYLQSQMQQVRPPGPPGPWTHLRKIQWFRWSALRGYSKSPPPPFKIQPPPCSAQTLRHLLRIHPPTPPLPPVSYVKNPPPHPHDIKSRFMLHYILRCIEYWRLESVLQFTHGYRGFLTTGSIETQYFPWHSSSLGRKDEKTSLGV